MGKLDELLDKKREFPESNMGGSFQCQQCFKKTDGAYYDHNNTTLFWRCPDGHISKIEEFVI